MTDIEFKNVVEGLNNESSTSLPFVPFKDYLELVEKLTGVVCEYDAYNYGYETSGFEVDFTLWFIHKDTKYTIGGSWFNGDYSISKETD